MFESNFPVDRSSGSYGVIWNAFKKMSRGHTAADRTALFHDTAARVYRLKHRRADKRSAIRVFLAAPKEDADCTPLTRPTSRGGCARGLGRARRWRSGRRR